MTGADPEARCAAALDEALARHGLQRAPLLVAFSGGPDSSLLLALAAARGPRRRVRAVHVDHGWHSASAEWAAHCRVVAAELRVSCEVVTVDCTARAGEGPEAAARAVRYAALAERLGRGEVLLTAHHADDQAETALFGLLRGGGVRALAAMPELRTFARGFHLRPLLERPRDVIAAAGAARGLATLADPANEDTDHDRVFLRQRVLPLLRERWPQIDGGLVRSSRLARDSVAVEDSLIAHDLAHCRGSRDGTLEVAPLMRLPPARQRALVRGWLRREGLAVAPERRLHEALRQVADAAPDRNPRIDWPGGEIRRWNGLLWARAPHPDPSPGERHVWSRPDRPLDLPDQRVQPERLVALFGGERPRGTVELVRRMGGERLVPAGTSRERALTELLRAAGLPPWQRGAALLVEHEGRVVGVLARGLTLRASEPPRPDSPTRYD